MATLYNSDLKPLESGTYTHYYDHATKLFLADNFRLAPKQKFLYYVCINIDQSALEQILPGFGGPQQRSSQTLIEQYETGLMAKTVELPRFNIQTRTIKAYNRKNIIQTGINYDPISITFHDDAADVVTKFWNDFYTYYYRDSDYDPNLYQVEHKYQARPRTLWGFNPRNKSTKPFLRDIQIFSLHNKRFTEYLLINPIISNWRHGIHDSSGNNELMEATMQVEFETVKYRTGYVNPVDVNGFATIHYDNTPSPISNSVTNIYNDSGIIGALTEGSTDLARPDGQGSGSGILGSVLSAFRFYNNLQDVNFKDLAQITLGQVGAKVLGGVINGAADRVFFPTSSQQQTTATLQNTTSTITSPYGNPGLSPSITQNGQAIASVLGSTVGFGTATVNNYTRGVTTPGSRPINPSSTALYELLQSNDTIKVDGRSGQPATETVTAYLLDSTGTRAVQEFQTVGSQSGTYDPTNKNTNVQYISQSTDPNGQTITKRQYRDGTIVWFNQQDQQIRMSEGYGTNTNNINTNPVNARDLAAQGQTLNPTQQQFYTDPSTGITRIVNGGTSGLVKNVLSGTTGAVTGLAIGGALYDGFKDTLGGGIIGSTVAAGISAAAGTAVGVGVNNLVQAGIDYFTGTPGQSFDPTSGKLQNVVANKVGTGAYTPAYPTRNTISLVDNGNGTKTLQTVDGGSSVVSKSTNDIQSQTSGPFNNISSWLGSLGVDKDSSILLPGPGFGVSTDAFGNPLDFGSGNFFNSGLPSTQDSTNNSFLSSSTQTFFGSAYDSTFESPGYNLSSLTALSNAFG